MSGYNRPELAEACCAALHDYLEADEPIEIRIADDGSDDPERLEQMLNAGLIHSYTVAPRRGIGGSLNTALSNLYGYRTHEDALWLYTTDDWLLTQQFNIQPAVDLIRQHDYDYVRLGPLHPDLLCKTRHHNEQWWLHLDQSAGGFAFATRPFLATRAFYTIVGRFAEHEDAYDTERHYAERVARTGSVNLAAIVPYGMHGPWSHVGAENDVGRIQPPQAVHA